MALRSKTPDGVRQEPWGYLCTTPIRALMTAAADDHGVDPDRISFTRAGLGAAAHTLTVALPAAVAEICHQLLPRRRLRAAARVVKRQRSNYGVKRAAHRNWPQPTRRPAEASTSSPVRKLRGTSTLTERYWD